MYSRFTEGVDNLDFPLLARLHTSIMYTYVCLCRGVQSHRPAVGPLSLMIPNYPKHCTSHHHGQCGAKLHRQKGLGMKKELLMVKELAAELRMSLNSTRRAYRKGEIPVQWLGRMARFNLATVQRAMERNGGSHMLRLNSNSPPQGAPPAG